MARWFHRRALQLGLVSGVIVLAASPLLADLFNTHGPLPFLAVGAALPAAMTAGVGRGYQQGLARFGRLAISFQAEMLVRLLLGAGLMTAGYGVAGGVGALTASVIAAALVVRVPTGRAGRIDAATRSHLVAALSPSITLLVGEALVNHADTVIAKHAFDPVTAGQFAAIALIGRTVFFVTWPVSMLVFPLAAARAARSEPVTPLLTVAVAAVSSVGAVAVAMAALAPEVIVDLTLGSLYVGQSRLLAPYVAATALFSTATTIMAFAVAIGRDRAAFATLAFGVLSTLVLLSYHPDPVALVWTQVALNAVAAAAAVAWALRRGDHGP
jgi:O-antigen/teichoic acid export membrane protein